jgi:hypothetical protein
MTNPEITSGRVDVRQPEAIQLRQILRNRYGIALLGLLVLLLLNATIIHFLPTRYQAAVVIEDRSGKHAEGAFGDGTTSDEPQVGGSPVCFPQTPFEVLTSEKIIAQLSLDLDLPTRFELSEGPAVLDRVRGMVKIEPIGGTDLFCLIVTDTEETRAMEIANGIYRAYEKVRDASILQQEEQADPAGIGPNHPDRLANLEQIATLRKILLPAAENQRRDLATKLARMEKQLEEARSSLGAIESAFQLRSIQYAIVATALHNYEYQKDILAELRVERVEETNSQTWLQSDTRLLLWSAATSAQRVHPYLPHKLFHPILGVIIGLSLGGGLVFLAASKNAPKTIP